MMTNFAVCMRTAIYKGHIACDGRGMTAMNRYNGGIDLGEYRNYQNGKRKRQTKKALHKAKMDRYLYLGTAILIIIALCCAFWSKGHTEGSGFWKKFGDSAVQKKQETSDENAGKQQKKNKKSTKKAVNNPNIRVLLKTSGYAGEIHPSVALSAGAGLLVECGDEQMEAGTSVNYQPDDPLFAKGNIRVRAVDGGEVTVESMERSYGAPSYEGVIELRSTAEGIAVINELPVESYLCKVVPSEMPADYEREALKAQAVCARGFTYRKLQEYAYPEYEAHVNDSTDFQVYGNVTAQESSTQAVQETAGEVIKYNGEIVTTYYYSTSCGRTTTMAAWGSAENEQNAYLQSVELKDKDGYYEESLPWYRWTAEIPETLLGNLISLNTGTELGTLKSLSVTGTGPGDVVTQILAVGDQGEVTVDTENKIRRALGGSGYTIQKQDGSVVDSGVLLPSAFFTVEYKEGNYVLHGGGFGHGIGMSQNGANQMAAKGMNYKEILGTFFVGITIECA